MQIETIPVYLFDMAAINVMILAVSGIISFKIAYKLLELIPGM